MRYIRVGLQTRPYCRLASGFSAQEGTLFKFCRRRCSQATRSGFSAEHWYGLASDAKALAVPVISSSSSSSSSDCREVFMLLLRDQRHHKRRRDPERADHLWHHQNPTDRKTLSFGHDSPPQETHRQRLHSPIVETGFKKRKSCMGATSIAVSAIWPLRALTAERASANKN